MSRPPEHDPFAPPPPPPRLRAWLLAIVAHGLLVAAMLWAVRMPPAMQEAAIEAELWSALPQEAAPPAPTPEPTPAPAPEVKPEPPPP
ncbi:MAG: protein TolA, partial [Comamonas sp.]